MSEVTPAPSCRNALIPAGSSRYQPLNLSLKWQCNVVRMEKNLKLVKRIQAQLVNPSTYSSRISTDIALYEIPEASFDQYLEEKPRVFKAIFPDKRRSQQINEEEWRVHMLPIEFLFLTVSPVIDMRLRCKSSWMGYPPGVPRDISKVLELDIIRWELQGLDEMLKPSQFTLNVKGALYPDRRGSRSRLKGQLQMSISFIIPPMLALIPEDIRRDVAESVRHLCPYLLWFYYTTCAYEAKCLLCDYIKVLKKLVENMKDKVNVSLIADYSAFKKETPKALA